MTYTVPDLLELQARFALEQPDAPPDAFEFWLDFIEFADQHGEEINANANNY